MTMAPVFVDAEGVVRDWVNSLEQDLVGQQNPLPLGAHLKRLRSPDHGAYLQLSLVSSDDDYLTGGASRARVSGAVRAATKAGAALAAVAYANALRTLSNTQVGSVMVLVADGITGPFYLPDGDEERYIVDADFYLAPWPYGSGTFGTGPFGG